MGREDNDRFADDLDLPDYSVLNQGVSAECCFIQTFQELFGLYYRSENVLQVEGFISLHR